MNSRIKIYTHVIILCANSSGVRFYYTEELKKNDASVLQLGLSPGIKYSQIVPQQLESFTSFGYCPAKCLDKGVQERPKVGKDKTSKRLNVLIF